jgi:hypothetical protein
VYFAAHLPHLVWQPSETHEELAALTERVRREAPANLRPPLLLDVREHPWPLARADALFSANTLHIMGWEGVQHFFRGAGVLLRGGGVLCVYGPMRYRGDYTSASNAEFDRFLKARDPQSGIRDFEALEQLAREAGLAFHADHPMPANNQTLVWRSAS